MGRQVFTVDEVTKMPPQDVLSAVGSVIGAGPEALSDSMTLYVHGRGSDDADGLTWRRAKRTIAAAVAALPGTGEIQLGGGIINETATTVISKPVKIIGRGCAIGGGSATTIQYPAGVPGIVVEAGGQTTVLEGFRIVSQSTDLDSADGIVIRGHGAKLDELHVQNWGRDGVVFDTTSGGNANACTIGRVRVQGSKRHGLRMAGIDSNLLTATNLEVVLNGGWGVLIESATVYGGVFLSPNIDTNTLGGVSDAGTGTRWISPDVEPGGGVGYTATLTGPGIIWEADGRTKPTLTYNANTQRVSVGGTPLQRLRLQSADQTKIMSWTMGVYEPTSLALTDDTNAVNVLNYRPSTKRFEHMTPMLVRGLYQTAITVPSSSSVTFDTQLGNIFVVTMTGNVTASTFGTSNIAGSPSVTVAIAQDATGGRAFAWPSNCRFAGGAAPTDTTANTMTSVTFRYDLTTAKWYETARAVAVPV